MHRCLCNCVQSLVPVWAVCRANVRAQIYMVFDQSRHLGALKTLWKLPMNMPNIIIWLRKCPRPTGTLITPHQHIMAAWSLLYFKGHQLWTSHYLGLCFDVCRVEIALALLPLTSTCTWVDVEYAQIHNLAVCHWALSLHCTVRSHEDTPKNDCPHECTATPCRMPEHWSDCSLSILMLVHPSEWFRELRILENSHFYICLVFIPSFKLISKW